MSSRIVNLFPTPLIIAEPPEAQALCAALKTTILAREAEAKGVKHSNLGGWQSPQDFFDWSGAAGARLAEIVRALADEHSGKRVGANIAHGSVRWHVGAWANVNRQGHENATHYHPGAYWSAVFYVDDGGINGETKLGGAIEFQDPRGALTVMYAPDVKMDIAHCQATSEQLSPKSGMLVMFPAWLPHRVTPFLGAGPRISVALNLLVMP